MVLILSCSDQLALRWHLYFRILLCSDNCFLLFFLVKVSAHSIIDPTTLCHKTSWIVYSRIATKLFFPNMHKHNIPNSIRWIAAAMTIWRGPAIAATSARWKAPPSWRSCPTGAITPAKDKVKIAIVNNLACQLWAYSPNQQTQDSPGKKIALNLITGQWCCPAPIAQHIHFDSFIIAKAANRDSKVICYKNIDSITSHLEKIILQFQGFQ